VNIFVPFTHLRAPTYLALKDIATLVPLTGDQAYSRYLMERWAEGKTFINVEHDVVPTVAQLEEIWNCSLPWCGYGYREGVEDTTAYLGCVKISAEFIAAHPNVWVLRSWASCDTYLAERARLPYHCHRGAVQHIHGNCVFMEREAAEPMPTFRLFK
jgi:hypothetical protein